MSDFAWTLIDIRRLRTLLIILFYKENVCVWDGINVVFCKESVDGMDGISTDLPFGVLVPMYICTHPILTFYRGRPRLRT